jgi:hypothetical protein
MKKTVGMGAFKLIYAQYKDYLLPIGLIVVSLLLFFNIIIPQISSFSKLQREMKKETDKLAILNNNITYLNSVNDTELQKDFNSSAAVLPLRKDFVGILSGVSDAAGKASVSIGDYQFKVGDLEESAKGRIKSTPFLEIDLNISGNAPDLLRFMKELEKTAPISDIQSGGSTSRNAFLTVRFYYSSIVPPANIGATAIKAIGTAEQSALRQIADWNNLERTVPILTPSTQSAELRSFGGPFQ